ncbi:MAG: YdcF family protein [Microcoleaceae cyanobacterium]
MLFISKLLPLFIYPLGLSCLLLIFALFSLWRTPRRAAIAIGLALFLLFTSGNAQASARLVYSLEKQYVPTADLPEASAIVVLGGGTKPMIPPRPWVDVSEAGDRILQGSLLYKQGKAPWLILSGGRIDWRGQQPPESEDMSLVAEVLGVPGSAILQDPNSLNTYENAVNVRQILEEKQIQPPVLLVTSAIHMPRSVAIFERQGISVIPAPTDFLVAPPLPQQEQKTLQAATLNLIPSALALKDSTFAIKEYIGYWVYRLRGWA